MMSEQSDVMSGPGVPLVSLKLALSKEVRASLEAVRVAEEKARLRARRQTVQARAWLATMVGIIGLTAVVAPRLAHWWKGRGQVAARSPARLVSPDPVATNRGSLPPSLALANTAPAPVTAPETAAAAMAQDSKDVTRAVAATDAVSAAAVAGKGCDTASARNMPWRLSPEACARAFAAEPGNATLALAVAQAEHARGHLPESAHWARRALALDPRAAEAYVLVARADLQAGRRDDARAAYRRYLELAPRGWHQGEAHRALR